MEPIAILSNSCVGWLTYDNLERDTEYNLPFIGTLIPNDKEYLKLCQNFEEYLNCAPVCDKNPKENTIFAIQNGSPWYKHKDISIPYPIIHLKDIELHCIHEDTCETALAKFFRRRQRFLDRKVKVIKTWSYSEIFNDHENQQELIDKFLDTTNSNEIALFVGPPKYKKGRENYLCVEEWDNVDLSRNSSHVYSFNDQYKTMYIIRDWVIQIFPSYRKIGTYFLVIDVSEEEKKILKDLGFCWVIENAYVTHTLKSTEELFQSLKKNFDGRKVLFAKQP